MEGKPGRLISEMVRNRRPLTPRTDATVIGACGQVDKRRVGAVLATATGEHDRLNIETDYWERV